MGLVEFNWQRKRYEKLLQRKNPNTSYYKSIQHHVLIEDIRRYYTDLKVQNMLENIIKNPIETPRGYKNADNGIALRGPLSQFFSALYLKPLDDAFDTMDVVYLRYQDDLIILCKTKRQLERCKRRLMHILQERRLQLSRKKTRIGAIETGFHFLAATRGCKGGLSSCVH
jgi:RNA-directed DNA polymerase